MNKYDLIWIICDSTARLPELMGGAGELGNKSCVFVLGSNDDVKTAFELGASQVYYLGDKKSDRIFEDYSSTIAKTISEGPDKALVITAGTRCGKAMAGLLGVKINAAAVTEVTSISIESDGVKASHMVYGGLAIGEEKINSSKAIISIGRGVFKPASQETGRSGDIIEVAYVEPKKAVVCTKREAKKGTTVDLNKAKRIVSVGRGFAKEEDLKLAEELCSAINAELGCTRPIAESEKWLSRERYIGISNAMPKPEIYIAVGISGQIQHMVGANGSQIIVSINKDKNAPIFKYSDYGIVGDLYKILPEITKKLKS